MSYRKIDACNVGDFVECVNVESVNFGKVGVVTMCTGNQKNSIVEAVTQGFTPRERFYERQRDLIKINTVPEENVVDIFDSIEEKKRNEACDISYSLFIGE